MEKKQLKKVKRAVELLIAASGVTTTLEVKNYLRAKYPEKNWVQADISTALASGLDIKDLSYVDNGTFRTYSIVPTDVKPKKKKDVVVGVIKTSATKMSRMIQDSKGKFFTVVFLKKDGEERTLNGNVKKGSMNDMGYINVKERNGDHRQINPKTIKSLHIGGQSYSLTGK